MVVGIYQEGGFSIVPQICWILARKKIQNFDIDLGYHPAGLSRKDLVEAITAPGIGES
jgi:hypothetical protein